MFGKNTQMIAVEQVKVKKQKRVSLDDLASSPRGVNPRSAKRRGAFIHVYVGKNGSGKSMAMMYDTLPDLEMGRKVLSSMPILSYERAETEEQAEKVWDDLGMLHVQPKDRLRLPHPLWIPLTDWRQVIAARDTVILFDEITGIADARDSASLPSQVLNALPQLRRANCVLRITSIDWSVLDKRLRELSIAVTLCSGHWAKEIPGSMWTSKRLFRYRTYDAKGFNDFTSAINRVSQKQRPRIMVGQWVLLTGGLAKASDAYSSEAQILMVGTANEAGMCLTCGGRRSAPRCNCEKEATGSRKGKNAMATPASGSEAVAMGFSRSEASAELSSAEGALPDLTDEGDFPLEVVTEHGGQHPDELDEDSCDCVADEPVQAGGRHARRLA